MKTLFNYSSHISSPNEASSCQLNFSYPFNSAVTRSPAFHQKYKQLPRDPDLSNNSMARRVSQASFYFNDKPPSGLNYRYNGGNDTREIISHTKSIPYLSNLTRIDPSGRPSVRVLDSSSSMTSIRDRGNSLSRYSTGPLKPTRSDLVTLTENLSLRGRTYEKSTSLYSNGTSKFRSPSCSAAESRLRKEDSFYTHADLHRTDRFCSPNTCPLNANNASNAFYERKNSVSTSRMSINSQGGLIGLNNLGNTCFMNSVIQCLSNTQLLVVACVDNAYEADLNKNSSMHGCLFTAYSDLMRQLWDATSARGSHVSPVRFKSQIQKFAPRFMGYSQQDAQEFLRYLLQGLHEDVNRVKSRPTSEVPDYDKEDKLPDAEKAVLYWRRYKAIDNSIIADLFMGQLMSTLECTSCGFKSTTFDPFWDLSLPIPKMSFVTIKDCFDLFTSKEVLDGAEQPKCRSLPMCSGCKSRQRCKKSFSIQRFPQILVIHFKRFSGERSRSKLTTYIEYPIDTLNLKDYASVCSSKVSARYTLYAVSNHSGSVFGGHYTAFCRHPFLNTWYEYNDTRVSQVSENEVVSSEAYVLFYQMQK